MIVTPELAALIVAKNKAEAMTRPDSLAIRHAINGALDRLAYCLKDNATRTGDIASIRMLIATLEAAPAPNAWKDAVLDALASTCQDAPIGASPADILQRVISFHVAVATDSRVSDSAHDPVWADEAMALHWIDRYAAGIDDEPQMDRILDCVFRPAPPATRDAVGIDEARDAARYRWLRAHCKPDVKHRLQWYLPRRAPLNAEGLDANIDAALTGDPR